MCRSTFAVILHRARLTLEASPCGVPERQRNLVPGAHLHPGLARGTSAACCIFLKGRTGFSQLSDERNPVCPVLIMLS